MVVGIHKKIIIGISVLCLLFLVSCSEKKEPEVFNVSENEQIVLKPVEFSDLQGWKNDDLEDMVFAFSESCKKILREKSEFLYETAIKISTNDYQRICIKFFDENISEGNSFKKFIKKNFSPWLVLENGNENGRFTSYYQAKINASMVKDERYKYPVYGLPDDLVEVDLNKLDAKLPKVKFIGRSENHKFVPYYTREEIENNDSVRENYPILLYADNPVDIYIMQTQGSATAEFEDGHKISLIYAGNNGHKFSGIGSILLEAGLLEKGKASIGEIKKWLEANIETAKLYMQKNKRYVFHKISDKVGEIGSQGVVLTPQRSLAVDKEKVPYGVMLWLETTGPNKEKLEKLVIAQDTGTAIKGAIRGDYFWGFGDEALEYAGKMSSIGRYYILVPKKDD